MQNPALPYCGSVTFGPVDSQLDLVALEHRALERWRAEGVLDSVVRLRQGAPRWVFYEGPPTANGRPGLHHVSSRAFKDLFIRYQTMRGHDVPRKGGWDCHGLPVEIEVEKELGIHNKHEIEAFGIAAFNERCRESVRRYVNDWESLTERAAVSIDTRNAYWTLDNSYVESVWWLLGQMWKNDLLYEGHRVSPYCARCGTALSSHELGQPGAYRDITDLSVYVRFPVEERDFDLLVWTTTPWTLISNVAAAVGPDIEYVRVRGEVDGRDLVMAAARASDDADVVERFVGRDLVGLRYQRPFDFLPLDDRGRRVVGADFVSLDEGTGIVHLAPAFGADDMEVARQEGLPVLNPVGPDGAFTADVAPWQGRFVKDADPDIVEELRRRGVLVREEPYVHSYPHCWRCGTPLIYWAKTSWFVRTSERRADLLRENERIGWHPEHIKHGRFGDWLENNVDWALSRDRYWGTPLPIWRCSEGHDTCVSSVAELSGLAGRDLSDLDLHRPYVDEVVLACPAEGCGGESRRLPPVLDAWFDSGSMPSAQHHYLGEKLEPDDFPAQFICEAIDQTRGWFYSLLAVNTLVFGATPFENVVCLGLIVDQDGQKMSKSKGNVIDPWQVFESLGADALRWYLFSAGSPWTSRRVYEDGIREATRKTLLTFWNVFSFFATYADIDGWTPDTPSAEPSHVLDRWILARLDATIDVATRGFDDFDVLTAATDVAVFVDDLSNWYVRRSRSRFWGSPDPSAYATLYRCLVATSQLLAPLTPFLADDIYVRLTGELSVHASDWPTVSATEDIALADEMAAARQLVGLGRAARTEAKLRTRQPLRRALLVHPPDVDLGPEVREQIREELNVKDLQDVASLADLVSWTAVPNFGRLGPRLGKKVNEVKQALAAADGTAIKATLDQRGWVDVAGERLDADDVELRADQREDFALASEGAWAVALDRDVDESLRVEGTARELVRAVNELRKKAGMSITDRIVVTVDVSRASRVAAALDEHGDSIAREVLAVKLAPAEVSEGYDLDLDGEPVRIAVSRADD
ncbi:MAG: Isoleucyl-tRNA synthetase [Acidimicrobiales bacterium]|nr:Isoleucyl-tRNA synthetase [Acidimicrobiales bacterium]